MFSTILKEVTGYFDRRALISAFFPSLIFWGVTVIGVLALQSGWNTSLERWEGLSVTAQALMLIAFLVWVACWAFLTINFQTALIRLYEGYWPDARVVARLYKQRRGHWQRYWDELERRDRELEEQENTLRDELDVFDELRSSLETALTATEQRLPADAEQVGVEFDVFLKKSENSLVQPNAKSPTAARLAELSEEVRDWWSRLVPYLQGVRGDTLGLWPQRRNRLSQLTARLERTLAQQLGEMEEQRLRLNHDFSLYYPPARDDVMPTKLGNVLKSAEMYTWGRYRLDAVVIWSRLQSVLPKEFADPLQDAKTSLDLMVTLSTFTLVFGLPLSASIAVKSTIFVGSVTLYLLILVPFLLGAVFFRHRYVAWVLALVGLLLIPASAIVSEVLLVQLGSQSPLSTAIIQFEVFLSLAFGVILLAWLIYHNAVEAGLAYGEKIKAAFDLHRWKVLDSLHLQLPPNFEVERKIWEEVCALLYRGFPPDPHYYRYAQQEQTKEAEPIPTPAAPLPVPVRALPAFYAIAADDIIEMDVPEAHIPAEAARTREHLVGYCPLVALPANQPIRRSCVIDPKQLNGTSAISIPATAAMALGGNLEAGDVIDIMLVSPPVEVHPASASTVFENILVLDVKPVPTSQSAEDEAPECPFVIVVALPHHHRPEFAAMGIEGKLLIARAHRR